MVQFQPNSSQKYDESEDLWDNFRRQMPVTRRWIYLDHAAVAPISKPARDAMTAWADECAFHGDTPWLNWSEGVEDVRSLAAELIGAKNEEIALIHNTTEGVNIVAEGFDWQEGDNVVTLADEFPTNQYPWMHLADRGVQTRRLPTERGRPDFEKLAEACDRRTRIVSISWVSFSSGWRNDLDRIAEIAHRSGALLFVDAIQGLGVFPINVQQTPIDFLAADGHKWLLGPEGAGIFFLRKEHLARLRPVGVGWNSVVHAHEFGLIDLILREEAARYEGGSQNMPGNLALGASMKMLLQFGTENISRRIVSLTTLACERLAQIGAKLLTDREPGHRSGIVVFELPNRDSREVRERCLQQGVVLSCRAGRLRISPHAYNNADDIEQFIEVLKGI